MEVDASSNARNAAHREGPTTPIQRLIRKLPRIKSGSHDGGRRKPDSVFSARNEKVVSPPRLPTSPSDVFMDTPWRNRQRRRLSSKPQVDVQPPARQSQPPTQPKPRARNVNEAGPARLALQQHDHVHDAIVVTTLLQYPFRCHEELVSMSREQLQGVTTQLNARLPVNSRLPESASSVQLRERIERLVGIGNGNGNALTRQEGRAVGNRDHVVDREVAYVSDERLPSPPSSPLARHASRKRRIRVSAAPPALESLAEEVVEGDGKRSMKRRRVSEQRRVKGSLEANQAPEEKFRRMDIRDRM